MSEAEDKARHKKAVRKYMRQIRDRQIAAIERTILEESLEHTRTCLVTITVRDALGTVILKQSGLADGDSDVEDARARAVAEVRIIGATAHTVSVFKDYRV